MSVDYASITLGTTDEAPVEAPTEGSAEAPVEAPLARDEAPLALVEALVEASIEAPAEAPANLPQSLGVVGYSAFALLQPVPLGELVPFPLVVTAFEAEASCQVLAPAPEPAPEPEPEDMVPDFTALAPAPAVSYAVGGYRPAPGPQMWGRELPEPGSAPEPARPDVEAPVDDSGLPEMAVPGELDRDAPGAAAVLAGGPFRLGGYATDRAIGDRQARQVLDELSFLFDGN